jgi:hypothetical protein
VYRILSKIFGWLTPIQKIWARSTHGDLSLASVSLLSRMSNQIYLDEDGQSLGEGEIQNQAEPTAVGIPE